MKFLEFFAYLSLASLAIANPISYKRSSAIKPINANGLYRRQTVQTPADALQLNCVYSDGTNTGLSETTLGVSDNKTLQCKLSKPPTGAATVTLRSRMILMNACSLTFTAANYDTAQNVNIKLAPLAKVSEAFDGPEIHAQITDGAASIAQTIALKANYGDPYKCVLSVYGGVFPFNSGSYVYGNGPDESSYYSVLNPGYYTLLNSTLGTIVTGHYVTYKVDNGTNIVGLEGITIQFGNNIILRSTLMESDLKIVDYKDAAEFSRFKFKQGSIDYKNVFNLDGFNGVNTTVQAKNGVAVEYKLYPTSNAHFFVISLGRHHVGKVAGGLCGTLESGDQSHPFFRLNNGDRTEVSYLNSQQTLNTELTASWALPSNENPWTSTAFNTVNTFSYDANMRQCSR